MECCGDVHAMKFCNAVQGAMSFGLDDLTSFGDALAPVSLPNSSITLIKNFGNTSFNFCESQKEHFNHLKVHFYWSNLRSSGDVDVTMWMNRNKINIKTNILWVIFICPQKSFVFNSIRFLDRMKNRNVNPSFGAVKKPAPKNRKNFRIIKLYRNNQFFTHKHNKKRILFQNISYEILFPIVSETSYSRHKIKFEYDEKTNQTSGVWKVHFHHSFRFQLGSVE